MAMSELYERMRRGEITREEFDAEVSLINRMHAYLVNGSSCIDSLADMPQEVREKMRRLRWKLTDQAYTYAHEVYDMMLQVS